MSDICDSIMLPELGVIRTQALLSEKHGNRVFRVECAFGKVIVKECSSSEEVRKHLLLRDLGLSVPEVYAYQDNIIVMQDLNMTPWRLANQNDLSDCSVAIALAEWYRLLHSLGGAYFALPSQAIEFHSEMEYLSPEYLEQITVKFQLSRNRKWKSIRNMLPELLDWVASQSQTLTYNDFYYTNFALRTDPMKVLVFDYHLLGYGMIAGDIRNVCSSLTERARLAFKLAYGPISEVQLAVDKPLGALNSLSQALDREVLPPWANEIVLNILNGRILEGIMKAAILIS